jgi:putative aminopeptidase FrvX
MHTPVEVLDLGDLQYAIALLTALCQRIDATRSFIPN